jgi:PucR C-terminal helix-turn-helix domain
MSGNHVNLISDVLVQARRRLAHQVDALPTHARHLVEQLLRDALVVHTHASHPADTTRQESAAARIRQAGQALAAAGLPAQDMIGGLGDLTSQLMTNVRCGHQFPLATLAELLVAGSQVEWEFMRGYRRGMAQPSSSAGARRELALSLLAGEPKPSDGLGPVADTYAVVALYSAAVIAVEEVEARARQCGGAATCSALYQCGGPMLLPARNTDHTQAVAAELRESLGGECWLAATWRPRLEISQGWGEARQVLTLAVAGQPPGVYGVDQVLTEYAVAQNPAVSARLAEVIEPLTAHPTLMDTLTALIDADGNRSLAATKLIIHRSTLDYRLQRITRFTRHNPTTTRGLHTLRTALTLHRIDSQRRCPE